MMGKKLLVTIILTSMMTSMVYGFTTPTFHPALTTATTAAAANARRHHHKKDTTTEEFDRLAWRDDTVMLVHFKYKGDKKISEQKVRYATKEECDDYNKSNRKAIIYLTIMAIAIIVFIIAIILF